MTAKHRKVAHVLRAQGLVSAAVLTLEQGLELEPSPENVSAFLRTVPFDPEYSPAMIRAFAERWAPSPLLRDHDNDSRAGRRLRVGFVADGFRDCVTALYSLPLFRSLDREQIEVIAYSHSPPDGVTAQHAAAVDCWRDVRGSSDDDVAAMIESDEIDVLVDLQMHMGIPHRKLFALRPAPVQVAWLAYPGTTGELAIDYRLSDPYSDPPEFAVDYTETTLRELESFWCIDPRVAVRPDAVPEVVAPPAEKNGFITFGCLNDFAKCSTQALLYFAEVLYAVHGSRLRLLCPFLGARERVSELFRDRGVSPSRIDFLSYQTRAHYLEEFARIDLCLDPLIYQGHTTSIESWWCGVPVISAIGPSMAARASVTIQRAIGEVRPCEGMVDFVTSALDWSSSVARLASLRRELRARVEASALMNSERFAEQFARAVRLMWLRWCGE